MATNNNSSSNPRVGKIGDVLDALSGGIAKTAANKPKFEPRHLAPEVPAEPTRELLTEKMLADRWESLDQFEIVLAEKVSTHALVRCWGFLRVVGYQKTNSCGVLPMNFRQ